MCYVLIGYWSTKEEDLYRVEKLRELKIEKNGSSSQKNKRPAFYNPGNGESLRRKSRKCFV